MAAPAQVTWAKVADNGAQLLAIGGVRKSFFGKSQWRLSTEEAIAMIEQDEWRFFVEIDDEKAWLDVLEEPDGSKTISAGGPLRNLL
jgi:hypothetical protein